MNRNKKGYQRERSKSENIVGFLILLLGFFSSIHCNYEEELKALESVKYDLKDVKLIEAYDYLAESDEVISHYTARMRKYSKGAWSFSILLSTIKDSRVYIQLFNESKYDAGKIYALMALETIDRGLYKKLWRRMKKDFEITVAIGSIFSPYDRQEIRKSIEGYYPMKLIDHILIENCPAEYPEELLIFPVEEEKGE